MKLRATNKPFYLNLLMKNREVITIIVAVNVIMYYVDLAVQSMWVHQVPLKSQVLQLNRLKHAKCLHNSLIMKQELVLSTGGACISKNQSQ